MRTILRILTSRFMLGLLAVVAVALAVNFFLSGGSNAQGKKQQPPVPVAVAAAEYSNLRDTIEALGTVEARETVEIRATVSDRIVRLYFDDGDYVRRGQSLVRLNDAAIRSQMAEAQATLEEQERQYERIKELVELEAASRAQLDEEEGLLKRARANVNSLRARLGDYTIRAPFSGRVGIRNVSPGMVVQPGEVITTLDDVSVVRLDFPVPQNFLADLERGKTIVARTESYPDRVFQGQVRAVDSRIDRESRAVIVRAYLSNKQGLLKPGMLLSVDLVKEQSRALVIPEGAVIMREDRKFVYVVGPDGSAVETDIRTGRRSPGLVEVVEGLSAGERVVTEGLVKVRNGAKLQVAAGDSSDESADTSVDGE